MWLPKNGKMSLVALSRNSNGSTAYARTYNKVFPKIVCTAGEVAAICELLHILFKFKIEKAIIERDALMVLKA